EAVRIRGAPRRREDRQSRDAGIACRHTGERAGIVAVAIVISGAVAIDSRAADAVNRNAADAVSRNAADAIECDAADASVVSTGIDTGAAGDERFGTAAESGHRNRAAAE